MRTLNLRRLTAVGAALTLTAALTACSALSSDSPSTSGASDDPSSTASQGKLAVSVSFYPIAYLAEAIGGEHVSVTSVTPANVEPHDFELSPKDVTSLSSAKVVLSVAGYQASMDDAVSQVSGPSVTDLSGVVDLRHHDGVQEHHDDAPATEAEADHDHDAGALDPHFWLDPSRMQKAADAVEKALAAADPQHASDYEANLKALTATLTDVDTSYTQGLSQCERTTFITSHAAFGYLADRYHLTQAPISGIDPESEPSPADLAAIKQVVQSTGTTTIFTEELVSPKTAQALASETGTTTKVLNPLESAPDSGDYASEMKSNLSELRTALACK